MTTVAPPPRETVALPLSMLEPHQHNPRRTSDGIDELKDSLALHGVLEPILVRFVAPLDHYEILSGHRRVAAAQALGWTEISSIVLECSEVEGLEILLTANEQREDVDPILEAQALDALVNEHAGSVSEVARRLGRSAQWVASRRALAGLSATWRGRFSQRPWSVWPMRCWTLLAGLVADEQDRFASSAVVQYWLDKPDPDPKRLEEALKDWVRVIGKAPFDPRDASLLPEAGACDLCPKTSQSVPGLFDDGEPTDLASARCRDRKCWETKCRRQLQARVKQAKKEHGKDLVVVVPKSHTGPMPKGAKVLTPARYAKAKKGEKGAVPAISAVGETTAVSYVKLRGGASSTAPGASKSKGQHQKSVADIKVEYEAATCVARCNAIASRVDDVKASPNARACLALIEAFGLEEEWNAKNRPARMRATAVCDEDLETMILRLFGDGALPRKRGLTSHPHTWQGPAVQLKEAKDDLEMARAVASTLCIPDEEIASIEEAAAAKVKRPAALDAAADSPAPRKRKAAAKKKAKRVARKKAAATQ